MSNKQAIYPDGLAHSYMESVGQPYRPSNGTEGAIFREAFCNHCQHDGNHDCLIYAKTPAFKKDHLQYPKEWQYGTDGQPTCTAFTELEKEPT